MPPQTDASRDKAALRAALRKRRRSLPPAERERLSGEAAAHILASGEWRTARRVALYIAVQGEMDTAGLRAAARQSGKEVLLPLCSKETRGHMEFAACPGEDDLLPGAHGIPEPPPHPPEDPPLSPPDIIIVPGVAFDKTGARLGQGGGYYDRLLELPLFAGSLRIGLAYSFQLVDRLPREPWDLPMHALCTEQGLVWITRQ